MAKKIITADQIAQKYENTGEVELEKKENDEGEKITLNKENIQMLMKLKKKMNEIDDDISK